MESEESEAPDPVRERLAAMVRAIRQHRRKVARRLEALRGDLAEAERGPEHRRHAEALLVHLRDVPARAARITLPDPRAPHETLDIALDPAVKPQVNAARYFKRAAKAERGLAEIPPRIAAAESEVLALDRVIEAAARALEPAAPPDAGLPKPAPAELDPAAVAAIERVFESLPPGLRRHAGVPQVRRPGKPAARRAPELPARLVPRRLKTHEGWDVLVGRNNDGNDHLTLHLARPEDYWFHVHGAAGSHVVLRRGKSANEPSKQTLHEVASWAAFYSQARTAGTVPVIFTLKKYVRKPRKSPPGTVVCEREKTLMVKPKEPPRTALADASLPGIAEAEG